MQHTENLSNALRHNKAGEVGQRIFEKRNFGFRFEFFQKQIQKVQRRFTQRMVPQRAVKINDD